jgi:hypothetical protein
VSAISGGEAGELAVPEPGLAAEAAPGQAAQDRPEVEAPLWRAALLATLPAWVVAHILIVLIQDLAERHTPPYAAAIPGRPPIHHLFTQLYTWDTAWYAGIAQHGYAGVPSEGIRFWPLLPLCVRALGLLGIDPLTGVLIVCWAAAFAFGALTYRLAYSLRPDRAFARRAAWLSQLAPGAFVLVMGYTEALAGLLAAAFLLAIRLGGEPGQGRRRWIRHAGGFVAGFCSGLVRPAGWMLCVPGVIEAARHVRRPSADAAARLAVAVSPLLGLGTFLWWVGVEYHDWLLPFSIQRQSNLRGTTLQDPIPSVLDSLNQVGNGAGAYTVILAIACLGLLWGCARRLPVSFTAWAAVSLAAAITAPHFSSFARYTAGILPLLLVGAMLTSDRRVWRWTICASAALCAYFAYQAFVGIYIP